MVLIAHECHSGRFFQKFKMEETSMGIFSILTHHAAMKKEASALPNMKTIPMPAIDAQGVASRVEALRMHLGLGKGEFAQSFGLDPSSYSKVISGEKPLKLDYGHAIAVRWGISMDFIYRGDLSKIDEPMRSIVITNLSTGKE